MLPGSFAMAISSTGRLKLGDELFGLAGQRGLGGAQARTWCRLSERKRHNPIDGWRRYWMSTDSKGAAVLWTAKKASRG